MEKQEDNIEKLNKKSQTPSIKDWFVNSWELFKISWVGIASIYILSIIALLVTISATGLLFLLPLFSYLPNIIKTQNFQPLLNDLVNFIPNILAFSVVAAILSVAYYFISNILIINFIDSKDRNIKINYLQKIKSTLLPFILLSILNFTILVGSMFAFIIPFIIFSFFISFAHYELIIENVKPIQAIRNSFRIVAQNFSDFMARYVIIIIASIAISMVMQQDSSIGQLINTLISIIMTLFTYAISFVLYRQLRANTDMDKPQSLKWMWIATIIGWVGAISILALTFKTLTNVAEKAGENAAPNLINKTLKDSPFATDSSELLER